MKIILVDPVGERFGFFDGPDHRGVTRDIRFSRFWEGDEGGNVGQFVTPTEAPRTLWWNSQRPFPRIGREPENPEGYDQYCLAKYVKKRRGGAFYCDTAIYWHPAYRRERRWFVWPQVASPNLVDRFARDYADYALFTLQEFLRDYDGSATILQQTSDQREN